MVLCVCGSFVRLVIDFEVIQGSFVWKELC